MFPQNLFIPDSFLVGIKNVNKEMRGFAIPKEYQKNGNEFFEKVNNWSDFLSSVTFFNTLRTGIKIVGVASRENSQNKFFKVEDRGFVFEINAKNLKHIIKNSTIIKGVIQDECIWAREEWESADPVTGVMEKWGANRLIVKDSITYDAVMSKYEIDEEEEEMDKSDIIKAVNEVVDDWIDRGKMFTAFDVSLQVKANGLDERHRNMKRHIHDRVAYHISNYVDYERTLISIPGANDAWLYHMEDENISRYKPLDRSSFDNKKDYFDSVTSNTDDEADDEIDEEATGLSINSRERIIIPVKMLRQAGLHSGDKAYAYIEDGDETVDIALRISSVKPTEDFEMLDTYIVDKSNNVMISTKKLAKFLQKSYDTFSIACDADEDCLIVFGF